MAQRSVRKINSGSTNSTSTSSTTGVYDWIQEHAVQLVGRKLKKFEIGALLVLIVAIVFGCMVRCSPIVFDDNKLHAITKNAVDANPGNVEAIFDAVLRGLQETYPQRIFNDSDWVFNCAGGFRTGMKIMHASITEYIIFWGSAVDTVGMSGRHFGDFHDFLISGEFTQWLEGNVKSKKFYPVEHVVHHRLHGSVVQLRAGTWMLEHFVGFIPTSLPFGVSDSIFSNMDLVTIAKTFYQYGRLVLYELLVQWKL